MSKFRDPTVKKFINSFGNISSTNDRSMSASGNLFHDENDFSYKLSATVESEQLASTQRAHQAVLTPTSSEMPPFLVVPSLPRMQ